MFVSFCFILCECVCVWLCIRVTRTSTTTTTHHGKSKTTYSSNFEQATNRCVLPHHHHRHTNVCVYSLFVSVCVKKKIESDTFVNVHVSCWEKSRFVCCFRIILSFTRIWFPFFLFLSFSVHSFYYLLCAYRITQLCKHSHTQHTHSHL